MKRQADGERDLSALAMFAGELKLGRAAAGLTQEQLADTIHNHPSLIARIETCRAVPTLDFARRCDEALGTNGVLARMQPQAKRVAFVPGFGQYLQVEEAAAILRYWEPLVVHGLLQTEDYARALITGTGAGDSEERVDQMVAARLERQAIILDRDEPPRLCAILDASVLRYEIGGPDVMHGQLEHLIEMARRPNVALHVVPDGAGAHPGLLGGMMIAGFADHDRPDVAYLETPLAGWLIEDANDVAQVILLYDTLRGEALSQRASAELLAKVVQEWT
jgi:transcriptional regulator with XRE-family HTH domain